MIVLKKESPLPGFYFQVPYQFSGVYPTKLGVGKVIFTNGICEFPGGFDLSFGFEGFF